MQHETVIGNFISVYCDQTPKKKGIENSELNDWQPYSTRDRDSVVADTSL